MTRRRSHHWLLRAYPKAYRELRGAEVLATLDELAPEGTRLDAGEVLNCCFHGAKLRLAATPPIAAGLALFLAALAVGAGFDLAQPPSYQSSALAIVGKASSSSAVVAVEMRNPFVRHLAESLSGSPLTSCTAGPKPGAPAELLAIQCTAGNSGLAASEANAFVAAYNRAIVLTSLKRDTELVHHASRWIELASSRLHSATPTERSTLERAIEHDSARRAAMRRTRALVALDGVQIGKLRLWGLRVVQFAAPGVELPQSSGNLLVAGSAGIAVALMVAAWLRRRPSPSWAG